MCVSGVKVLNRESLVPRNLEQIAVREKELWQVPLLLANIRKWKISKAMSGRDRRLCGW